MEHIIGVLLEPIIGLFTVCTEVVAICLDGCLQTCRESFRCIGCNSCCSSCNSDYDDEESRPILSQQTQQPTAQAQPMQAVVVLQEEMQSGALSGHCVITVADDHEPDKGM